MRLPVFELVDRTIGLLNQNRCELENKAAQLQAYFMALFSENCESMVTITTRVKGDDSLKEKIFRKKLYKRYPYPEGILKNLSDLIGLRVECRFLADEVTLSKTLQEKFTVKADDGYYYCPQDAMIRLEMEEMQPQTQNNGFKIYRIDGMFGPVGDAVRFELQIKALVHVFWAEVEHEIIYKNNSYMLMDSFMKELLSQAYANLSLVDNQLYLIYRQIQEQTEPEQNYLRHGTAHSLFAKAISDVFYLKMRQSLGVTLNLKYSCDILSRYILYKQARAQNPGSETIFDLLGRVNQVIGMRLEFDTPLELEDDYFSDQPFNSILGGYLVAQMNGDYEWNLLFRMLFTLEPGSRLEGFSELIGMIGMQLADDSLYAPMFESWPKEQAERFRKTLLVHAAHQMVADGGVHIIYESSISRIRGRIRDVAAAFAAAEPPESLPRMALWTGEETNTEEP